MVVMMVAVVVSFCFWFFVNASRHFRLVDPKLSLDQKVIPYQVCCRNPQTCQHWTNLASSAACWMGMRNISDIILTIISYSAFWYSYPCWTPTQGPPLGGGLENLLSWRFGTRLPTSSFSPKPNQSGTYMVRCWKAWTSTLVNLFHTKDMARN